VYRRDYEGGVAVVNASGNPVTVDLGGSYRKISGTQVPSINDGSLVTRVTVAPEDGVIVLRQGGTTSPQTTSDAAPTYLGSATITLHATDQGGPGVADTYYAVDGGTPLTYTSPFTVTGIGGHTLTYWSVDSDGTAESARSASISVVASAQSLLATSIKISASQASVSLPKTFVLSGQLTPGRMQDASIVEVKKPGKAYWSYSSARLASTTPGAWWYRYAPKVRGTYYFRVRFAGDASRLGCLSSTVRVVVR
jgi:hypothetical protein